MGLVLRRRNATEKNIIIIIIIIINIHAAKKKKGGGVKENWLQNNCQVTSVSVIIFFNITQVLKYAHTQKFPSPRACKYWGCLQSLQTGVWH